MHLIPLLPTTLILAFQFSYKKNVRGGAGGERGFELLYFIIILVTRNFSLCEFIWEAWAWFLSGATTGRNSVNLSYVLHDNIDRNSATRKKREKRFQVTFHSEHKEKWLNLSVDGSGTLSRIVWIINVSVSFEAIKMCLIKYNSLSISFGVWCIRSFRGFLKPFSVGPDNLRERIFWAFSGLLWMLRHRKFWALEWKYLVYLFENMGLFENSVTHI